MNRFQFCVCPYLGAYQCLICVFIFFVGMCFIRTVEFVMSRFRREKGDTQIELGVGRATAVQELKKTMTCLSQYIKLVLKDLF